MLRHSIKPCSRTLNWLHEQRQCPGLHANCVRAVQAKRDAFLELEALARAGDNEQRMKIARHVGLVGAALESTSTFAQDRLAAEVQVLAILLVAQLARTSYCRTLLPAGS